MWLPTDHWGVSNFTLISCIPVTKKGCSLRCAGKIENLWLDPPNTLDLTALALHSIPYGHVAYKL